MNHLFYPCYTFKDFYNLIYFPLDSKVTFEINLGNIHFCQKGLYHIIRDSTLGSNFLIDMLDLYSTSVLE